jgi:Holliday junction resolvasome RuvABC endonuclease subunit
MDKSTITSWESQLDTLVLAIDPGSGASSPTGISLFNPITKDIIFTTNLFSMYKPTEHRIKDITQQLAAILDQLNNERYEVYIESFVMRGKGGETLQRLIGAFISSIPFDIKIRYVQNTKVKLKMANHGHADKLQVCQGVISWFKENKTSFDLLNQLTTRGEFDIMDSLAIGVTGWISKRM